MASAVIQFNHEGADEGLTPLGTELNVDEIKSSAIMSKVLENLSLGEDSYSVDDLISRLSVTEVVDEDEQAAKDAAIENGEEYTYEPTVFIISFTAQYDEGRVLHGKCWTRCWMFILLSILRSTLIPVPQ